MILMRRSTFNVACGKVRAARSRTSRRPMMKRQHTWPPGHWAWPIRVTHKHGVRCGSMIWVGGQVDLSSWGEVLHPGALDQQIPVVIRHLGRVLAGLDAELADLV